MNSGFFKVSFFLVFLMSIALWNTSCYYDNEEELYESNVCISENMSFKNDIVPIINRNCILCHSNATSNSLGAGINLDGYDNVKIYVDNSGLIGSINHTSGFSPMPKGGGKIPNCDIEKIQNWINDGSPNN